MIARSRLWIETHACLLCAGITLIGLLLRLYELGARSLWFDEAIEVLIARAPIGRMQAVGISWFYADPPLYSWLLHLVLRAGFSEVSLRLPSVLFGSVAVYASYQLFRLWVDAPRALLAQALLAVAPAQVYYSQEVSQNALMVALGVFICWAFERAVRRTDWRRVAVFSLLSVTGVFAHYGILWLVAGLAVTLPLRQKPRIWLRWWIAGVSLGLAVVCLFFLVIQQQFRAMQALFPASWPSLRTAFSLAELRSVGDQLLRTAWLFTEYGANWTGRPSAVTWLFVVALLIGVALAVSRPAQRPILALLFFPLLLSWLASKLGLYFWGGRYLLFLSPMLYLVLGSGLAALEKPVQMISVLVSVAALTLLLANQVYPSWPNRFPGEHIRPIVKQVLDRRKPGDGIYVYYGAQPAFLVYYSGPLDDVKIGVWFRNRPLPEQLADIEPFVASHPHTWFVASHMIPAEVDSILASLDQRCLRAIFLEEPGALAAKYDCTG